MTASDQLKPKRQSSALWPLAPAVLLLIVIFVIPVAQLLKLSFYDEEGGLSILNYLRLTETPLYVRVLGSTFKVAFWTTGACLVASYPVAYLIATIKGRWKSVLLICVLMPFWTSVLVRTFAWVLILGRHGMINQALASLGLAPEELIYNFNSVVVGMAHALVPLAVLTMLSVMQNIDMKLCLAASTLGARGSHVFWRIYFPLSLPGVAAAGLLVFISALGFFITSSLLGSPRETMLAQIIISQIDEALDWGFAGAVAVLLLLASAIVFFIFDRVLGTAALTGEIPEGQAKQSAFDRWIKRLGRRLLAGISWACVWISVLFDPLLSRNTQKSQQERSRPILWLCAITVALFLALPSFILIPVSFTASSSFEWPPQGFSIRWYQTFFNSPLWETATIRSLLVGAATAIMSVAFGTPAAFVLSRRKVPAKTAVMAFLLLPMVMPHIIVALALYYAFSKIGLVGTSLGLILGHTIFSLPYVVITVMAVLRNYDERLDQAAWTLGASKFVAFRKITYPLIRTGMMTALLFAFVKSFDELTVALFISAGTSTTLPRQMWAEALMNISPTLAAASSLILIFVIVVIVAGQAIANRKSATA